MNRNDHKRIADFVASKLNLPQEIWEALRKGSEAPDLEEKSRYASGRKGKAHHRSREIDIDSYISSARRSFCKQEMAESAESLGRAFHFIADSFITPTRDDEDKHGKEEKLISQLQLADIPVRRLDISKEIVSFVESNISQKDIPIEKKLERACDVCLTVADSVWRGYTLLTNIEKDLLLADFSTNQRLEEETKLLQEEEKGLRNVETKKIKKIGASSTPLIIAISVAVISYFYGSKDWAWYMWCAILSALGIWYIRANWGSELSQIRHRLNTIHVEITEKKKVVCKKFEWYWEHPLILKEIKEEAERTKIARKEKVAKEQTFQIQTQKVQLTTKETLKLCRPSFASLCAGCIWIIFPFLPHNILLYSIYLAAGVGALSLGIIGLLRISKYSQKLRGKTESIIGIVLGVTLMSINGYFIGLDITHNKILSKSASQKLPIYTTEDTLLLGEKTKAELKEEFKDKPPDVVEEANKKGKDTSETAVEVKPPKPTSALDPDKFYANTTSNIFHRQECSLLKRDEGVVSFSSHAEAKKSGGVPCKLCLKDTDKVR